MQGQRVENPWDILDFADGDWDDSKSDRLEICGPCGFIDSLLLAVEALVLDVPVDFHPPTQATVCKIHPSWSTTRLDLFLGLEVEITRSDGDSSQF